MIRFALFAVLGAVSAAAPAAATTDSRQPSAGGAPVARPAVPPVQSGTAPDEIKLNCDVRRPSCRRWQALAEERLEDAKESN